MRGWLLICSTVFLAPTLAQSQAPEELFVPVLINGVVGESSHYQTVFRFMELSGTTASPAVVVTLDAYRNDGKQIPPYLLFCPVSGVPEIQPYPVPVSLPGWGSVHLGTAGEVLGLYGAVYFIDGWARLSVKGPGRVQATAEVFEVAGPPGGCPPIICNRPSDLYTSDAVVQAVKPAKVWRAATVITSYRHTAFSVVNPSATESAHVLFGLYSPDGREFQGGGLTIPPMQRRSAFAWEWATFPLPLGFEPRLMPDDFYGSARIVSDVPVAVGGLQVLLPEGKLVSAVVTAEP